MTTYPAAALAWPLRPTPVASWAGHQCCLLPAGGSAWQVSDLTADQGGGQRS